MMRIAENRHFLFAGFCLILLQISYGIQAQQKMQFTQYMFDGMVLNPAYAGANEALSLTLLTRDQWTGVEGAPSTQTLTAHTLFKKKKVGVGLSINRDIIGVHKNLNIVTSYAYHLYLNNQSVLSFGISAGFYNRKSDYASLLDETTNDPVVQNGNLSQSSLDFGAGLYFRSPRFHAGYSAPEILPQQINYNDSLSIRLKEVNHFLFTKYIYPLNENFDVEPGFLLKKFPGLPLSYDLNVNVVYRRILTTGISYRKKESIDFIFKGQVTSQLQVGYSYDYPIGNVSLLTNASHELMIQYLFRFRQSNVASPR